MKKRSTVKIYEKILKKDKDFDFAYLLILERFKLKRMIDSFSKATMPHEHISFNVRDMKICVNCIDIILEEDIHSVNHFKKYEDFDIKLHTTENEDGTYTLDTSNWISPTFDHYVNINNAKRFNFEIIKDVNQNLFEHMKMDLRQIKALHLYNLIRNKLMSWWW
jgi:hypothetical protein